MKINGTITKVTVLPPVTSSKSGKVWEKCEAVVTFPGENPQYNDSLVATVLRESGNVDGWQRIAFNHDGTPVAVVVTVSFRAREYNGRTYQDVILQNIEAR